MEIIKVEPTPSPNTMKIILSEKGKIIIQKLIRKSQIVSHTLSTPYYKLKV